MGEGSLFHRRTDSSGTGIEAAKANRNNCEELGGEKPGDESWSPEPSHSISFITWCSMTLRKKFFNRLKSKATVVDPEAELMDAPIARHKPEGILELAAETKFTHRELQFMYRGFKQECPHGVMSSEDFQAVFAKFFPLGDSGPYARLVFNAFDRDREGVVTFTDVIRNLSLIFRGEPDDRLHWLFSMYDINRDGVLSQEEILEVTTAIYDLMGAATAYPPFDSRTCEEHAAKIFQARAPELQPILSGRSATKVATV
ncbi:unnamed protein product [Cyprideis torosa]|uniref:Uncharacterized protein n=1 Tax=Cyprideis torosa TaxID=163714 RepID=A0A7R8ZGA8_9CRUS|nr:unnamed protein product [Cyprideis torosa]CAG0881232.1 unnamed protein product [Cyprideis torosa]